MGIKNLKILLLFTIQIMVLSTIYSQDTLSSQWVIRKASTLGLGDAAGWALGGDSNGDLYWSINIETDGFLNFKDVQTFKIDPEGNELWENITAEGDFNQQAYHSVATDTVIYVGGRTCRTLFGIDSCDVLFYAVDVETRETKWSFTWDGGYGYEEIDGISLQEDGIILTGWTTGENSLFDLLLMKIDYHGNLLWVNTWGSIDDREDHQDGHIVVDDSLIYLCGLYQGLPPLGFEGRSLLAKFDKFTGAFVDSTLFGRQDNWINAENALGMTSDGNYLYITGHTTSSVNNWQLFVTKYDKDLNQIWYKTWGGERAETGRGIAISEDNHLYIAANTESYGTEEFDMALLKYDLSGNFLGYQLWGGSEVELVHDIYIHQNDIYLNGETQSFHPQQNMEAFLIKVAPDEATSIFNPAQAPSLNISPNPMTSQSLLSFENPLNQPHTFSLFDTTGKLIYTKTDIRSNQYQIDKGGLPPGVYFFELRTHQKNIGSGKLMIVDY